MAKTILIAGYGPGISTAVAETFGAKGFQLALVGRTKEKLEAGVKELAAKGIKAQSFVADLSDEAAARGVVKKVREALGPITVLEWTAYAGAAGDLLTASAKDVQSALGVATTSLLGAIQEALPDLKAAKDGAVLVTNGGLGFFDPQVDAVAVQWGAMGLAVANAAKHKIVGLLAAKLKTEGVYVGEVMVTGAVKGTPFDDGSATIEAKTIAAKFWALYESRNETFATI